MEEIVHSNEQKYKNINILVLHEPTAIGEEVHLLEHS